MENGELLSLFFSFNPSVCLFTPFSSCVCVCGWVSEWHASLTSAALLTKCMNDIIQVSGITSNRQKFVCHCQRLLCVSFSITAMKLKQHSELNYWLHQKTDMLACMWMFMNLVQSWFDDRYYRTLRLDTSQTDLDRDPRSQECKKATTCAAVISQSFVSVGLMLLRLVTVMNLIPIWSHPFSIQRRESCLYDFMKHKIR